MVSIEKDLGPALLWDRLCPRSLHGPAASLGSAGSMVAWSPWAPWRIFCQGPLSYIRCLCLFIEFSSPSQPRKWVLFTFCDAVAKTVDMDNLKQGTFIFLMVWEDSVTFRERLVEQCPSDEGRGGSGREG